MQYDLEEAENHEREINRVLKNKGYSSKNFLKYVKEKLGKYNPQVSFIKNARYAGKDLISIRFNEDKFEKIKFTVDKIKILSDMFSQFLQEKNYNAKFMTSMRYGDLNWKSGYLRNVGEEVKLYDPNELYNLEVPYDVPKNIEAFNMYIILGNRNAGGNDKFNDCLYNCLKYYIFNIEDYFESAPKFKKYLGLKRSDKVSIELLDKVEKKLKHFQINVRGDFIRSSTINSNKQINLILMNEHYEVEKVNRKLIKIPRYEEKIPILVDSKTFEAYDGEKLYTISKEEYNNIKYNYKSPYLILNRERQGRNEQGERIVLSLIEEYNLFIENATTLKTESKGLINLFKTGSYHDCALSLFDRLTKFINPDEIYQDEAIWNKECSYSALIWCEKGYEGEVHKYDVKSMYPSFMSTNTLKFPIKRGEFRIIESINQYPEFGIYHCYIRKSNDDNINKLFKFNFHHKYNSIDIVNARNLGLEIELIQDNQPNFLHYSRDKLITFFEVFKQYTDILFPLKDKGVNKSKMILNILWGALCEVDKKKLFITNQFSIPDEEEIVGIVPHEDISGEMHHIIQTTKINSYYKTPFARLCPYLISQGRKQMSTFMFPYKEHIKQIQTDGFISDILIHENRNVKMGELKYEGYNSNAFIKHCNSKIEVI